MEEKPVPFKGATVINGFKWPPLTRTDTAEGLRNVNVREDDIYVVTYPKAGTHWSFEILINILYAGDKEQMKEDKCPTFPIEFMDIYKKFGELPTDKPRVLMTHAPVDVLPKQLFEGKGKVVIVMRNPKDTCVSYWHFLRERRFLEEYDQWETFFSAYLKPDMMNGDWFDYNLSYYEHRNKSNFYFTTYEEMKLDHKGTVIQLSDFISRPLTDELVDQIVQNTTFNYMKKKVYTGVHKVKNTLKDLPHAEAAGPPDQKFTLMRKGIVGDWKTQFTVAQSELFDQVYNEKMKESPLKNRIIFEMN